MTGVQRETSFVAKYGVVQIVTPPQYLRHLPRDKRHVAARNPADVVGSRNKNADANKRPRGDGMHYETSSLVVIAIFAIQLSQFATQHFDFFHQSVELFFDDSPAFVNF